MTVNQFYFEFANRRNDFFCDVEEEMIEMSNLSERTETLPEWTHLDFQRCPHCTLSEQDCRYCPPALGMVKIVQRFSESVSFEIVTLHITSTTQKHSITTDLQTALAYLYPAILLKSDCPYAHLLRPMEKFFKPFYSFEDVLFYVLSFDLIKKCIADGGPDASDAAEDDRNPYNLATAFHGLLNRVRTASHNDANINAIFKNIQWSCSVLHSRQHILERMKPYFSD